MSTLSVRPDGTGKYQVLKNGEVIKTGMSRLAAHKFASAKTKQDAWGAFLDECRKATAAEQRARDIINGRAR